MFRINYTIIITQSDNMFVIRFVVIASQSISFLYACYLLLIRRRVRSGAVDAHPTETAIVVNYELDAFVLGENGEPVIGDHKVRTIINYFNVFLTKTSFIKLSINVEFETYFYYS